jgi:DNA repair exonuclease SbcCD ATPase subunit
MPEPLVACPSCGLQVPKGKFCKLCGEPLMQSKTEAIPEHSLELETELNTTEEIQEIEPSSLPHFEVTIEDMHYDAAAILLARAELIVIDDELDRMIEKIKATRQALQLQQADKSVLTTRAEALRIEFEQTKARRRELISVKEQLVLEQILDALEKHETRLSKLEEIASTVDKEVYKEQKIEILQNIKDLRSDLKEAIKTGKKWSKGITKTLKILDKELSRLDAKFKIGDVSRSKYEISKAKIERGIKVVTGGQQRLDELLRLAEKK